MEKPTDKVDSIKKDPRKKVVFDQPTLLDVIDEKSVSMRGEVDGAVSFLSTLKNRRGYILKKSVVAGLIILGTSLFLSFAISFINSFERNYPSVINFGDIMLDRGIRNIIEKSKRDPFVNIKKDKSVLHKYDFVVANLEGPIVEMDRSSCQQKLYSFQFSEDSADKLKNVGINILNLANNHSYDCYSEGLKNTRDHLNRVGISYIGGNTPESSYVVKEIDGKKIVLIGIDVTLETIPMAKFYTLIKDLKSKNDYIVVNIHWGKEYSKVQTGSQVEIAHKLSDSGADVIFGHHPHVVEPVEIYNSSVIFYSLGNFVFDQDFGDTKIGLGAGVEFEKKKMRVTLYPFNIVRFTPEFMKGDELYSFCNTYLNELESIGCSFEVLR